MHRHPTTQKAAKLLKVMGNPYRLHLLHLLTQGEKNVSELNAAIPISQPALSQHLARLKREGLITSRRAQRQIYYTIIGSDAVRLLQLAHEAAGGAPVVPGKAAAQSA
jgi:predicted transcriptional regulator